MTEPTAVTGRLRRPLATIMLAVVSFYRRFISPALPASCRYYPTCSGYAVEAIEVHGALKGGALSAWRIMRCHPWSRGGPDPVPPARGTKSPSQEESSA